MFSDVIISSVSSIYGDAGIIFSVCDLCDIKIYHINFERQLKRDTGLSTFPMCRHFKNNTKFCKEEYLSGFGDRFSNREC